MWADLISLAAVGVLAACLLFIIRHTLKRRGRNLPRWIMPAVVGASMMGYSVWNEYSWFGRITSSLPSTVAIVGRGERSAFWAPWTYTMPVTVRFVALDSRVRVQSEQRPGLVLTELLLVERWQPTRRVPVAFDCHEARRADLVGGARIEPDGTLEGARWQAMEPDSPMMRLVCQTTLPD
jgi:hypothetical protein